MGNVSVMAALERRKKLIWRITMASLFFTTSTLLVLRHPPVEIYYPKSYNSYHAIIYNRVPKCGSTAVLAVLSELTRINNFEYLHSKQYDDYTPNETTINEIATTLEQYSTSVVYDRHFNWVNFSSRGLQSYKYINLIREPVRRLVSNFYYAVQQKYWTSYYKRNQSFDECFAMKDVMCVSPVPGILSMFCGVSQECMEWSQYALQTAKDNAHKEYLLVGIQEDMDSFFLALEHMAPLFFKGALTIYQINDATLREQFHGNYTMPSQKTIDTLSKHIALDIEFYNFVKQLFYSKLESLGIKQFHWTDHTKVQ